MTRTAAVFIAALMLTSPHPIAAQTAPDFAGDWKPARQPPVLAELKIAQAGQGWTAHAFGSCTPTPCDWGAVPLTVLQQRPAGRSVGVAIWRRGTATRYVVMRLGEDALPVIIYNLFSGPRDQPSYLVVGEMSKSAPPRTSPRK